MGSAYETVEHAFIQSIPSELVPLAAYDHLAAYIDILKQLGIENELYDEETNNDILNPACHMVMLWFDQWDELHPNTQEMRDLDIIKKMREFLHQHQIPEPMEISTYLSMKESGYYTIEQLN